MKRMLLAICLVFGVSGLDAKERSHGHLFHGLFKDHRVDQRDYWAAISVDDDNDIHFIMNTLGYKSLTTIMQKKNQLKEAATRINYLHPLRFLLTIFCDEELNAGIRAIQSRGWIWSAFVDGIYASLAEETEKNNMTEDFVRDFCYAIGIQEEFLQDEILDVLNREEWDEFMMLLFNYVPRNDNFDRYDMYTQVS